MAQPASPATVREAARAVLAADGRDFLLRPWQVAYLVDLSEGRDGVVPVACGLGRGWLEERLREAVTAQAARAVSSSPDEPESGAGHGTPTDAPSVAG